MEGRLAAMLSAQTGTQVRLETLRQDLLQPPVAEHHGRIVELIGDGLLIGLPA